MEDGNNEHIVFEEVFLAQSKRWLLELLLIELRRVQDNQRCLQIVINARNDKVAWLEQLGFVQHSQRLKATKAVLQMESHEDRKVLHGPGSILDPS